MTSQLSSLDSVLDRLATVEAQNRSIRRAGAVVLSLVGAVLIMAQARPPSQTVRSEEHTSELQSQSNLVCRLLLEKKKKKNTTQLCVNAVRRSRRQTLKTSHCPQHQCAT